MMGLKPLGLSQYDGMIRSELYEEIDRLTKQRDELARVMEMTYKMLLSEPDTKGALFKAENLLREALVEVKERTNEQ